MEAYDEETFYCFFQHLSYRKTLPFELIQTITIFNIHKFMRKYKIIINYSITHSEQ